MQGELKMVHLTHRFLVSIRLFQERNHQLFVSLVLVLFNSVVMIKKLPYTYFLLS